MRRDDRTNHAHADLNQLDARLDHGLAQVINATHVARMGKTALEWPEVLFELLVALHELGDGALG